ncbi:MAG: AAA family ATPase [Lachnospiraceae bacterium]|nr:AAA family ATPase [Lachnospiraceae bacterium]
MSGKRDAEIKVLTEYMNRNGSQMLILYGERGVGKTTLLSEFTRDYEDVICFDCSIVSEREQLYLWGQKMSSVLGDLPDYPTFSDIFGALGRQTEYSGKRVIIFDEFQNISKVSEDFTDYLFTHLQTSRRDVLIILCSSQVEWIENSMVKKFGLRAKNISGFLKVKELSFAEFVREFKQFTLQECVEGYAVFGGFPAIWNLIDKKLSLEENIIRNVCNPAGRLHGYGVQTVESQLRETSVYNTILCALAHGKYKLNDLYQHTGFSRAKISVYIKNLMELGILEKDFSVDTEGRENLQKGLYGIKNRYVDFTYQFLFSNEVELSKLGAEEFYRQRIRPDLKAYVQKTFAAICREYIESENRKNALPFPVKSVGKWTGKVGNIDIVATDENGRTIIGLCNWEKPMMKYEDYEWLLFCAKQAKLQVEYVYLISAGGFDEKLHLVQKSRANVRLLTPDRM